MRSAGGCEPSFRARALRLRSKARLSLVLWTSPFVFPLVRGRVVLADTPERVADYPQSTKV